LSETSPSPVGRPLVAFLVAPLAAPVVMAVIFLVTWTLDPSWFGEERLEGLWRQILDFGTGAVGLTYAAEVILGIPAYFLVRRKLTLRTAAMTGAAVALLPVLALMAVVLQQNASLAIGASAWVVLTVALSGVACGGLFWWIATPTRQLESLHALRPDETPSGG
jgi:hypothetical protein